MGSLPNSGFESEIPHELLVSEITKIHESVSKLKSLKPSNQVNSLLTRLVRLCTPSSSIDIESLPQEVQVMRGSLIELCGQAEGLLELEFATSLSRTPDPMKKLEVFPYYENYVKLAALEYRMLSENGVLNPKRVAFVGSGPMPLTSLVMATNHLQNTQFDNFDIDEAANDLARKIVASQNDMEKRMKFVTRDVMEVKEEFAEYDCIFLAALVGMRKEEKAKIIGHIGKYVKKGGYLLVRSAKGARAFLYPVVEEHHLLGFEVISEFHPTDDVINSIILARKPFV